MAFFWLAELYRAVLVGQIMRENVSPLQGLEFWLRDTRAFSPGYHMAGLRPFEIGAATSTFAPLTSERDVGILAV